MLSLTGRGHLIVHDHADEPVPTRTPDTPLEVHEHWVSFFMGGARWTVPRERVVRIEWLAGPTSRIRIGDGLEGDVPPDDETVDGDLMTAVPDWARSPEAVVRHINDRGATKNGRPA